MAISIQSSIEFDVFGDGVTKTATFNLGAAPFTAGGVLGLNLAAVGIGTPSSVSIESFTDNGGNQNPGGNTVQASLLVAALTLTFSQAIPNDGLPYTILVNFTYNG